MVILATNLEQNLDAAFRRRMHVVASFPMPGPAERLAIWRRQLDPAHLAPDVDLPFLAGRFARSGGDIRNAAIAAVLLAAEAGSAVAMPHVVRAVWRELRGAGRLASPEDLGPWRGVVSDLSQRAT
jgi:SpoVK/Ycf46/Vps4 family AAA+-type ATPase